MTNESSYEQKMKEEDVFPSLLNRIQALFFDFWVIVGIVMALTLTIFESFDEQFAGFKIALFLMVFFVYEPFMSASGGTIGHRTMGITIRKFEDPKCRLNLFQAYFRTAIKFTLGWISFLNLNFDPFKRAMHDKFSGSVVIYSRTY